MEALNIAFLVEMGIVYARSPGTVEFLKISSYCF